jgi:hypothetical protein
LKKKILVYDVLENKKDYLTYTKTIVYNTCKPMIRYKIALSYPRTGFYGITGILLFLLLSISVNTFSADDVHSNDDHSGHDLQRGKRLFHGLVKPSIGEAVNCASCHNVYYIDTLNWNPSALDIARKSSGFDSLKFANALNNPISKKLMESHVKINLNGEELALIRKYLHKIETVGEEKNQPNVIKLLVFAFMFMIFGWAVTDLIIIKKVEQKYVHTLVLLVSTIYMANVLIGEAIKVGRSQDYQPLQPIKFSHQVHATENQIDCQYCHHTAEHSKSAGIPSANLCLNCHSLVREGTHSGRFEIDKIHTAVDSSHPIEWIRIHRLPDFIYFNHAQHVGAGKLDCRECHGTIEDMHVVKQQNDLSMGWCLDCHRTRSVDFLGNDYYGMTFKDFHDKIKSGEMDSVTVADIGGEDCMKCHY